MFPGIESSIKNVVSKAIETAKVKDLKRDTVTMSGASGLTTDFGGKISDDDNWSDRRPLCRLYI